MAGKRTGDLTASRQQTPDVRPRVRPEQGDTVPVLPLDMLTETFPGIGDLVGQLRPRSLREYTLDAQHYLAWCGYRVARALDPAALRQWRQYLVEHPSPETGRWLSPKTINRRLTAIKRFVRASAASDALDATLAARFQLVALVSEAALRERLSGRGMRGITPSEMRTLCQAPDPMTLMGLRDRALLYTLASSGVRVHEAATLKAVDIASHEGSYVVSVLGKGQARPRPAPLASVAYDWVQRWLRARARASGESAYVFTALQPRSLRPLARPLSPYGVWWRAKSYARPVGLEWVSAHDFRAYVATQIRARTGDPRLAQLALGHKQAATTERYFRDKDLPPGLGEGLQ